MVQGNTTSKSFLNWLIGFRHKAVHLFSMFKVWANTMASEGLIKTEEAGTLEMTSNCAPLRLSACRASHALSLPLSLPSTTQPAPLNPPNPHPLTLPPPAPPPYLSKNCNSLYGFKGWGINSLIGTLNPLPKKLFFIKFVMWFLCIRVKNTLIYLSILYD